MAEVSSLNSAIAAVQQAGIELKKDASANYGDYATLGNVLDQLRPVIAEAGLFIEQAPTIYKESTPVLATRLAYGDESRTYFTLLTDVANMQKVGGSITYARRYALVSIFLLDADEDDDGNDASGKEATVVKKKAASGGSRVL